MEQNSQSQLKHLIIRGKELGYLTYADLNDHLPEEIIDSDQIEDIIQMINDMGIQVLEEAPDSDDMLLSENVPDEEAVEAATALVLSNVESEIGRTTDPVRMYMREMGAVELLTREGEIDIAKRIEDGINQVQTSVSEYPEAITYLLEQYNLVEQGTVRLSDLITGFVDPNAQESIEDLPEELEDENSTLNLDDDQDDEDEETDSTDDDTSIDPEVAREKFLALKVQHEKTSEAIKKYGRSNKKARQEIENLSEIFKQFRLVGKQFDILVNSMREMMERVRSHERVIMKICVEQCKMPKKQFMTYFTGNENNMNWFEKAMKSKGANAEKLSEFDKDIAQQTEQLQQIETETNLSIEQIKDINRRMSIGEAKARRAKKEMGSLAIFSTLRILSSGICIFSDNSSGVGSRPISCKIWREIRLSLLIVSII